METTTKQNITSGSAAIIAILAVVISVGLVGQENVYVCLDTEIAMKCDKLSAVNTEGTQTRCYYFSEEKNRTTYKVCSSGWLPYDPQLDVKKVNFTDPVYLICQKTNELISECQIINDTKIIYKAENS